MSIAVSVVVPTFRRPELLARCLEALLAQEFAPEDYEIVIVDDAASKQTRLQVERYARQARAQGRQVFYLSTTGQRGPAAARNLGWRAARGEVIAFTDDDCLPAPDWLREGLAAFRGDVMAVSGRIRVPVPPQPTDYEYDTSHLEESEFATANCLYRRSALLAVGGFDERFTAAWREDSDLFFLLLERGMRAIRCPSAVVVHPVRPARWGVSLFQQRKAMFNALLYKKHSKLYRQRIQATPLWHYYWMTGALLLTLLALLCMLWPLAILAMLTWLALTVRFCWRRLAHTSRAPAHVGEMLITSALIPPLALFWRLRGMLIFRVLFL
ncbi:MAG TPA: glycosyltransferase [Ktedonobacteraceae bacterium]|nr:glycosyltransferase [Ktedonobacteraceae bacterium]